ncbi:hypothetical protein V8G54_008313 [Vigna mungo]|uniref:Retrovirus-related Pol polyprotein from transposon TNT 1-94 n=1 Tax=Vigna mungo TaxID=3915 RepID=A0AAQ3P4Z5_VIGMU
MLGYSETSGTFRVYNSRTLKVEEVIHVKFNLDPYLYKSKLDNSFSKLQINDTLSKEENVFTLVDALNGNEEIQPEKPLDNTFEERKEPNSLHCLIVMNYPLEKIIGNMNEHVRTIAYHKQPTIKCQSSSRR